MIRIASLTDQPTKAKVFEA